MDTEGIARRWNDYLAAYGPLPADQRVRLLQQSVADGVLFTNPGGEGKTRAGLIAHIEDFQTKMPGAIFKSDKLFVHHGECMAIWSMYASDDAKVATGYNFVRLDDAGRFVYIAGFF